MTAEAGHRVHRQQCAAGVNQVGNAVQRLMGAGAGFGMNEAKQPGARVPLEGRANLLQGKHVAPAGFQGMDGCAAALHDLFHPGAKNAVDADDDLVARLNQVHGEALHAGHTRAGNREGKLILGAKNLPQQLAGLVHDGDILRVQVAQGRRPQRAQNTKGHGTGARPQEKTFGGVEWSL